MRYKQSTFEGPKVTVIGGGTGNFTVLTGLKPLVGEGLTAVVAMADDGGSTGILRDQHGVLPAGDARQCLVALSDEPELRDLFNVRFSDEDGFGAAHNFGNLLFLAGERTTGSFSGALKLASRILNITGTVVPATHDDRRLKIETLDGQIIEGEHTAEETPIKSLKGAQVGFDTEPTTISPEAEAAIKESELTVIAPGDLYTSIAPALAVKGMAEALKQTTVLQVSNLMNRPRHTVGFGVEDYAEEIERISGAKLDYVLYNTSSPSSAARAAYMAEGEKVVDFDKKVLKRKPYHAVGKDLLSQTAIDIDKNDILANTRSLIRHDPTKVARAIMTILYGNGN